MTKYISRLILSAGLTGVIAGSALPAFSQETTSTRIIESLTTPAQSIKERLDTIFHDDKWRTSRFGVIARDLESGQIIYENDSEKSLVPASNMKIYTTALALSKLGKDFRYETPIIACGDIQADGTLKGNIVVVGQGDPSISGRYFTKEDITTTGILKEWAQAIKKAGITKVEGSIIGDDDIFDDEEYAGIWQQEYFAEWYAAESSGLAVNENCWDVDVIPAAEPGKRAQIVPRIPTSYLNFASLMQTTPKVAGKSGSTRIDISRKVGTNETTLSGTITLGNAPYKEWGSIHNGTLHAATLLHEALLREGVKVEGNPRDIDYLTDSEKRDLASASQKLLHTQVSPPLSKLIAIINKPSQNFYADMLAKTVAAKFGKKGSYNEAGKILKEFLNQNGIDSYGVTMTDGSGLSRQDYVTPRATIDLLTYMSKRDDFQVYYDSLPIMGVDGTLATRLRGTPLEKNVHAKTGTIGRVRSLSGFMTTTGGRKLVFSMIANNFPVPTSDATEAQDDALKVLLDWKPE